jgi:hypothetical protein
MIPNPVPGCGGHRRHHPSASWTGGWDVYSSVICWEFLAFGERHHILTVMTPCGSMITTQVFGLHMERLTHKVIVRDTRRL